MYRHKLLIVVGTRPHFIKVAALYRALAANPELKTCLVHTGQHYDEALSGAFFEELHLPGPDHHLNIGSGRQAWQMGRMIEAIDTVIEQETPNIIIVIGDTNSTAAGAIAGAKNHVPVAHVEAGLREFDKRIPEEVNKLLITAAADLFFCPTPSALDNLRRMGVREGVHLVGDVLIDQLEALLPVIRNNQAPLDRFGAREDQYFFATCHRASNTEAPEKLEAILRALGRLPLPVVFAMHPRTVKAIEQFRLGALLQAPNIIAVPPQRFLDTQSLIRHARATVTDSGGVIREAYFHHTPGIIIDTQTEWVETVEEGWNHLAGPDEEEILRLAASIRPPATHGHCLGDGHAAERIIRIIDNFLGR